MHATACVWRDQQTTLLSLFSLSFIWVSPGNQILVARILSKHLYPLSSLNGSLRIFFRSNCLCLHVLVSQAHDRFILRDHYVQPEFQKLLYKPYCAWHIKAKVTLIFSLSWLLQIGPPFKPMFFLSCNSLVLTHTLHFDLVWAPHWPGSSLLEDTSRRMSPFASEVLYYQGRTQVVTGRPISPSSLCSFFQAMHASL